MSMTDKSSKPARAAGAKTEQKDEMMTAELIVAPIGELVTPAVDRGPARRRQMHEILRIPNAAIAVADGRIIFVGSADAISSSVRTDSNTKFVDARNRVVSPGLVDPHTHVLFAGNRANEFVMRCQGKSYSEIAAAGGGIVASMSATRTASRAQLTDLARVRLSRMLQHGTTTAEIKTGYGLDLHSELNMFESIYDLASQESIDVVPTFMPAHAFPPGKDRCEYVDQIVTDMLPQARQISQRRGKENGHPCVNAFVDVFCDQGYFSLADTKRIFDAARDNGFGLKVHADEFANLGATTLAAQYGATSCDHLLNISQTEIDLLSQSQTVAVLLPGTSFYLNLDAHAPARKMIDAGVAVALGSDFNPGSCHIFSLPIILALACLHLKMTPEEALTALTLNAAFAIGLGDTVGMLREGYQADITIYDVSTLEEIPYNIGWNPVVSVIKRGALVVA